MLSKETLILKSRLIFVPFLIIAVGFISLYTLFNCHFFQTGLLKLDNKFVKHWIPLALPWVPVLIWLRPRINVLQLNRKNGRNLYGLYYFVAAVAIIAPAIILQGYVDEAYGKLVPLSSIKDLDVNNPGKFYTIKDFYINKRQPGLKVYWKVRGKYNEHLDLTALVTCPILLKSEAPPLNRRFPNTEGKPLYVLDGVIVPIERLRTIRRQDIKNVEILKGQAAVRRYGEAAKDGVALISLKFPLPRRVSSKRLRRDTCRAWLCIDYRKSISNRLSERVRKQLLSEFVASSKKTFNNADLSNFQYLRRVPEGSEKSNYIKAISRSKYASGTNPALFTPVYEPFEARGGNKLKWAAGTFLGFSSLFYIMVIFANISRVKLRRFSNPKARIWSVAPVYKFIQEQAALYVTWTIVLFNVIVFMAMVFNGKGFITFQGEDLVAWGANYGPYVRQGEWWRLLSSVFLHGGIMHLFFNIYGLIFVGLFLEPMLGRVKFALSYLLFGILGSLSSFLWYDATLSVGASGAIFGLYGIFLALLLTNLFPTEFRKALLLNTALYVGLNLLMGLGGGIDNAAHLGGLTSGLILGFIFYFGLKAKELEAERAEDPEPERTEV